MKKNIIYVNILNTMNNEYGINKNDNLITIILTVITKIINGKGMFNECDLLKSLPYIYEWDTKNIKNMDNLFSGCRSLVLLTNISKLVTKNVKGTVSTFSACRSLQSLPDISK